VELGERRQCVVCREMTKVRARRLAVFFPVILSRKKRHPLENAFSFSFSFSFARL
jgi:hypothetical protein